MHTLRGSMTYFFIIHAHIPEFRTGNELCFKYPVCMN